MEKNGEIINKLILKTISNEIKWDVNRTTCHADVFITDEKFISYKIGKSFHKGFYEKSLTIKLTMKRVTMRILVLYANRYIGINKLENYIRK